MPSNLRIPGLLTVALLFQSAVRADASRPDIVVADFEGDSYDDWIVEGTAFGTAPACGTLPGQMAVDGFRVRGLVNPFAGGETPAT